MIVDGWEWNMKEHIRLSTLYKNSQFAHNNSQTDREDRPFKNIVAPILSLQYHAVGFDVKDIILYVDEEDEEFKSFLAKKYHTRWAVENQIDSFIDEMVESYCDYGLAFVKDINAVKPEVVPLSSIAFCDQSNILGGPVAMLHFWSPDELQDLVSLGYGDPAHGADVTIDELIILAKEYKVPNSQTGQQVKTPGKYIKGYEMHGMMPETWLPNMEKSGNPDKYVRQMQIVGFYKDKDGKEEGVTLFAGREKPGLFKALKRKPIHGRACGLGGVEELFDPQIWTNYGEAVMKGMLDAASVMIIKTTDAGLKARNPNGLREMENLSILDYEEGKDVSQLNTTPVNIAIFENMVDRWREGGQSISAVSDALLGGLPMGNSSFKLQNLIVQQGQGIHQYQQGKVASFTETLYNDWILEDIAADIVKGKKFLETLDLKDLQYIADALVTCQSNDVIEEKILSGKEIIPSDINNLKVGIRSNFMRKGTKQFLELLKGEMKDLPLCVKVDIIGKQKDLEKIANIVQGIITQVIAAPQIMQIPGMGDLFNQIIEYAGLNPVDFSMITKPAPLPPAKQPTPSPVIPAQAVAA